MLALWRAPTSKQPTPLGVERRNRQPGLAWRLTHIATYGTFLEGLVAFYCREAAVCVSKTWLPDDIGPTNG